MIVDTWLIAYVNIYCICM